MSDDDRIIGISTALTARHDQTTAQIADTAVRIGEFYTVLIGKGISHEAATAMTQEFCSMLLCQHFGIDYERGSGGDSPFSVFGL